MKTNWRTLALWLTLIVVFFGIYKFFSPHPQQRGFAEFEQDLNASRVAVVRFELVGAQGNLTRLHVALRGGTTYTTANFALAEAIDVVSENQIPYTFEQAPESSLSSILASFLPTLVLLVLFLFIMRALRSPQKNQTVDQMTQARITAQPPPAAVPLVGLDEERRVLLAAVADLKAGRPGPRKLLLSGPPGAGKTQLVRWLAAESGLQWVPLPGSDVANVFVGLGAARVRRLFEVATEHGPCIALLEDLDAMAARRPAAGEGKAEVEGQLTEQVQSLLELCNILDGVRPFPANVLFIATTNRLDRVDDAVIRPGRIDLHLQFPAREQADEQRVSVP